MVKPTPLHALRKRSTQHENISTQNLTNDACGSASHAAAHLLCQLSLPPLLHYLRSWTRASSTCQGPLARVRRWRCCTPSSWTCGASPRQQTMAGRHGGRRGAIRTSRSSESARTTLQHALCCMRCARSHRGCTALRGLSQSAVFHFHVSVSIRSTGHNVSHTHAHTTHSHLVRTTVSSDIRHRTKSAQT